MKNLNLPELSIAFENDMPDDVILMALGGRKPSAGWLKRLKFHNGLWAVDKGVDSCREAGLIPDKLIGDKDSADPQAWQWALDNGTPASVYDSDKDLTDFQIALEIIAEEYPDDQRGVFLTGCFGGRFDHLWSTVISFQNSMDDYVPLGMADEKEGMILLHGAASAKFTFAREPEALSLIPLSLECAGVSISGVRWPLDDVILEYGFPYSVSNRLNPGLSAGVSVTAGLMAVYWSFR